MTTQRGRPRSKFVRAIKNRGFVVLGGGATMLSIIALGVLLFSIIKEGRHRIDGFDRNAYTAARGPQIPDLFDDLTRVDWARASTDLGHAALAGLDDLPWSRVKSKFDLEYADEIEIVDWSLVRDDGAPTIDVEALTAMPWDDVLADVQVPGDGVISAAFKSSELGQFMTSPPSRHAGKAGIGPALMGTVWICAICCFVALPLGVGTAVFLEEFKPTSRVLRRAHSFVQLNITNLAGVPSIVYGIIGLTAFVQAFGLFGVRNEPWALGTPDDWYHVQIPFGRGVFAGGLTLSLVVLPIVIISAQEAIRAVPDSLRQGSLALGATRWQMIRRMTLPAAVPGIMTGSILAMSRAIGEAAPILIICGIVFIRFTPEHLMDEFTALPLQIYDWAGRPQESFHAVAASGILVLLVALLTFNAAAIFVRQTLQKPLQ